MDRRDFLRLAGAAIPASVTGLAAVSDGRGLRGPLLRASLGEGGYGPLRDHGILLLPDGFQLSALSRVGAPMADGRPTPIAFDGMAAFGARGGRVRLVRNHEDRNGPTSAIGANPYDPAGGGGTTTLELDADRRLVRDFVSLSGTVANCAGGPTPWGSWLSCEETVAGRAEGFERSHGWIFEVPASAEGPVPPVPLRDMGRFRHEAVAVDPRTGIVYETEDSPHPPGSGLYRFIPREPGRLAAGGRLQIARVRGEPRLELFRGASAGVEVGSTFDVEWADLDVVDPGDDLSERDRQIALFTAGLAKGAAVFDRLEGCWFGDGGVFFHDTQGGPRRAGHVWHYVPGPAEGQGGTDDRGVLRLVFESPGAEVLDRPDNITVSPRGGLVLCEDGGGAQYLRGLTRDGRIFDLAQNRLNRSEFAGACFSPDGDTLFVNIQGSTSGRPTDAAVAGVTLAIWGPWARGAL